MFTPQEIQEKTFVKAVFGGYDMGSVDDFLEPLTEDFIALYKENAVLKSKMKILVEKLEEYRAQEESMKKALMTAQKTYDTMIAEAEQKCARMTLDAENALRGKAETVQQQVSAEEDRIERAKQAAINFIEVIEKDVSRHLDLLNNLKMMNLQAAAPRTKVYDFEKEPAKARTSAVRITDEAPAPQAPEETQEQSIASEIEQNLERMMGMDDDDDMDKTRVARSTKFADLQFGKNYDPTRK